MPAVSIIMPAYNAGRFIKAAIDGALAQTFTDFELIVINDGSTDDTETILNGYDDARLRPIKNAQNMGITRTLNRGLEAATGEYIARMDADDISKPDRLQKQVDYMRSHPDVGMTAMLYDVMDEDGHLLHTRLPDFKTYSEAYIRWRLLWHNPIHHTTVMLRRSALDEMQYDPDFVACEDYDLWVRLSHHTRITLLPEVGATQRIVGTSITQTQQPIQAEGVRRIIARELKRYCGANLSEGGMETLTAFMVNQPDAKQDYRDAANILISATQYAMQQVDAKTDREQILAEAVRYLDQLYQLARTHQPDSAMQILWRRRGLEMRYDLINTVKRPLRRILRKR